MYPEYLIHHGVKGMKWGVRKKYEPKGRRHKTYGDLNWAKTSNKQFIKNKDGSYTIPKGFTFNRVGKASLDVNKSGALYVSHGKQDAARYVKNLGPTLRGKLMKNYGTHVQNISVSDNLHMPSDEQTMSIMSSEAAKMFLSNKNALQNFNDSLYSSLVTGSLDKSISEVDLLACIKNPTSTSAKKLAAGISAALGNSDFSKEAQVLYGKFREKGYDAIPDLYDRHTGASSTAMIVIQPSKLKIEQATMITKDVMKEAKSFVKTLEKLPVDEIYK